MNLPKQIPGAYAIAFLIWGVAAKELPIAMVAAAVLELPRLTNRLFDVDERAYRMAWLLTLLLEWMLAINGWLELNRMEAMRNILKWTPMALFPIAMASAVARSPGVPVSTLLLLLKNRYLRPSMGGVVPMVPRYDPFLPMLWVIVLSASYQASPRWFYFGVALLMGYVFLATSARAGRLRTGLIWGGFALLAGVFLHTSILRLYRAVEEAIYGRMQGTSAQENNRTMSRIGGVDEVKLKKTILWWVHYVDGEMPRYLYEATYDDFDMNYHFWSNSDRNLRKFESVAPRKLPKAGEQASAWIFSAKDKEAAVRARCRIRGMADDDVTILPLPVDTGEITDLPAFRVDRNGLGVVRADCAEPIIDYLALSSGQNPLRPPMVSTRDLDLDKHALQLISPIVQQLDLTGSTPQAGLQKIERYFAENFTYTRKIHKTGMRQFLQQTKAGHCEFFATGTVLLLRAAGIPARYNTGFVLSEFDPQIQRWKVRGSHAHAWATAWMDGAWRIVDTTPPDWLAQDASNPDLWQRWADWIREKMMAFQEWRESAATGNWMTWFAPITAALAVLYTIVRLIMGRKKLALASPSSAQEISYTPWQGQSHWLIILPEMERIVGHRPTNLPSHDWVTQQNQWPESVRRAALSLVREHNRARFGMPTQNQLGSAQNAELDSMLTMLRHYIEHQSRVPSN